MAAAIAGMIVALFVIVINVAWMGWLFLFIVAVVNTLANSCTLDPLWIPRATNCE